MALTKSNETPTEVFLLALDDSGAPAVPGGYIYLPPPTDPLYTLRFVIEGTSSVCREGSLWVNIPAPGSAFDRNTFREFKLQPDFNRSIEIDVPVTCAGAFAYYLIYTPLPTYSTDRVPRPDPTKTDKFYIDVSPRLSLENKVLPLNALSIFSIISKFMGQYPPDWTKHLEGISRRAYNMVHFTPLVERGVSNSPYSIYDQLNFDPLSFPNGEKDVAKLVENMESQFGLLGLTDVVWNHTANNSKWLELHPEAGYNVVTAPWLEPALELDDKLLEFSANLEKLKLPVDIKSSKDLDRIVTAIDEEVLQKIKLWEYYAVDVRRSAEAATSRWVNNDVVIPPHGFGGGQFGGLDGVKGWSEKQKALFLSENAMKDDGRLSGRYARHTDPQIAAGLLTVLYGRYDPNSSKDADKTAVQNEMLKILEVLNVPLYDEFDADKAAILEQLRNRIKYMRLDDNGPKIGPVTKSNPLIETYFTRLPKTEQTAKHDPRSLALANNGWIWNADAMIDHAGPKSKAYLRREVIVWGDCVKLRYGSSPQDNPWLWKYMADYTKLMAKYFTGFRIDNCHSTPIAVAEYLLDEARKVKPNLVVFAELFTGSEEMDYVFVKRLGISSLIREAMQAWSTGEMSRLVHKHGGRPIGSFEVDGASNAIQLVKKVQQSPVHALFMDCTHDNEVPAQKRDAKDTLPNAALVCMCDCATGSVMGYDEVYPKLVDLVKEKRHYTSASSGGPLGKGNDGGIGKVKKILNDIHTLMGRDGYSEMHVHHDGEYITVHRVHPKSRKGYFLIAHTAYPGHSERAKLEPVHLTGTEVRHIGSWNLEVDSSDEEKEAALKDLDSLKGLPSRMVTLKDPKVEQSPGDKSNVTISCPEKFPPGSISLFETWIPGAEHAEGLDNFVTGGAKEAFADLTLIDLNYFLYRCEAEERASSDGRDGPYNIPGHGSLVYAGLQGWWSVLKDVIKDNNLGHPICEHLRAGSWALNYIVGRLEKLESRGNDRLAKPAAWLKSRFDAIKLVPSFLLPRYFALTIRTAYEAARQQAIGLMSPEIRNGQPFLQDLAMVSVQQLGFVPSASLYPTIEVPSLAAGLPHFSTDWARCWGRDVFISLRGLLLGTGRFDDAKEHIVAFGSVLKHGMIPNLLSSGRLPRYNARDSVWFFLQSIQDYVDMAPNGISILKEPVARRFLPYDDTWFSHDDPRAYSKSSTIEEIIQEVFQRHASGLSFREYNAGPELDMQMKPEGFQIDVHVDSDTGFIFGGSRWNCGTWQDKMGESDQAGSKGVPGTPRDGAAVEIIGLLCSSLVWADKLYKRNLISFHDVTLENGQKITTAEWARRIKIHFERCFFVPADNDGSFASDPALVHRRDIYKDLYGSTNPREDYQLRANFPIAMCVAPELFTPSRARAALARADTILRGPTGMATLDPQDPDYRPYYVNSEDSSDFATSKGRNYHQGPEWVWPTGYFLRAFLKFDLMRRETEAERLESFQQVTRRLEGCKRAIADSPWAGLTELTQRGGEFCPDSSPTQAWSASCLIDLFHDAAKVRSR
ncbi:MAG: hypothetical protein M1814_001005 [Vezdaea aestivalis]|nr:MAG: hypothetical protein M1814_001005 [Vezdaea aestivalis]